MKPLRDNTGFTFIALGLMLLMGCTLFKNPESCFEPSVYRSVPGNPIQFENCSTNGKSWLWDFGDGTTSDQEHPTHSYDEYGVYTVTLVSTLKEDQSDSLSQTVIVGDLILEQIDFINFIDGDRDPVNLSIFDPNSTLVRAPNFLLDSPAYTLEIDPELTLPDSLYTFLVDGQILGEEEFTLPIYDEVAPDMSIWYPIPNANEGQGLRLYFKSR